MSKYKYLLFDLDDTLIDNKENIKFAFEVILNDMKDTYADEKFDRWYEIDKNFWLDRQNGKIVVPKEYENPRELMVSWTRAQRFIIYFNNEISLEKAMNLNDIYMEGLKEKVIPVDGAYEVLEKLSNNHEIVVITNGPSVATRTKLEKIDCLKFVKDVLSADMFGHMKPAKEFFDGVKDKIKISDNNKFLIVGDSLKSDVEGANKNGMDSCWFDRGNETLTEEYRPTYIIKQLKELLDVL